MRKIQTTYTKFNKFLLAAIGDSLTYNTTLGVNPDEFYPEALAIRLRALGATVRAFNYGVSGNTSTAVIARLPNIVASLKQQGQTYPDLAIIFTGVNDPGGSISGATTTSNVQQIIRFFSNACINVASAETALPANNPIGERWLVQSDGSTTGGQTGTVGSHLTGTLTGIQIWECVNPSAGVAGWGRVANARVGTQMILVSNPQFLNYSTGADTPGAQNGTYAGVSTAVAAAVTNENALVANTCVFHNLWQFQANLITNGQVAQGTWQAFHVLDANQHPNPSGGRWYAASMLATLQAQSGWLAALTQN